MQTEMFQKFSGAKKNKQRHSKFYRNKEEQTDYSKAFQEQRGANQISPILFRTKVEQR